MGYNRRIGFSCSSPMLHFGPALRGFFIGGNMESMRLVLLAAVVSAAWCFNGWLDYLSINTKESTTRMLSLDKKAVEMVKVRRCGVDIELKKYDGDDAR